MAVQIDLDLVIHRGGDRGLEDRRAELLAVASIGVRHDNQKLLGHRVLPGIFDQHLFAMLWPERP